MTAPTPAGDRILLAAWYLATSAPGAAIARSLRAVADTGPTHPEWPDAERIARTVVGDIDTRGAIE